METGGNERKVALVAWSQSHDPAAGERVPWSSGLLTERCAARLAEVNRTRTWRDWD